MSSDLLPCPFCGGSFVAQGASRERISVWCGCGARGPDVPFPENCDPLPQIQKCFGLWNRRIYFNRDRLARHLAMLDNIRLQDIRSTVGPAEDANNWREYLGRADDLLAALSADMASSPPHHSTERDEG